MKIIIIIIILVNTLKISAQVPSYRIKRNSSKSNRITLITQESLISKTESNSSYIIDIENKRDSVKERYLKTLDTLNNIYRGKTDGDLNKKEQLIKSKNLLLTSINELTQKIEDFTGELEKERMSVKCWNFVLTERKSKAFFELLYDNNKNFLILQNTGFSFGNSTGSVYSELVSGNLSVFRVSFGSMLTKSSLEENNTEEEAIQKLASNGGNTMLTFEYPLLYIH